MKTLCKTSEDKNIPQWHLHCESLATDRAALDECGMRTGWFSLPVMVQSPHLSSPWPSVCCPSSSLIWLVQRPLGVSIPQSRSSSSSDPCQVRRLPPCPIPASQPGPVDFEMIMIPSSFRLSNGCTPCGDTLMQITYTYLSVSFRRPVALSFAHTGMSGQASRNSQSCLLSFWFWVH